MAGIIGYGAYIPRNRIKVEEIAKIWGADAPSYKRGLGLEEKAVPGPDQDTITLSVEASRKAIVRAGIDPREIGAVYVGSESHPYAVKPSGTILAEAIGATPEVHSASFEFACKAGTEAMFVCLCEVESGRIKYGLAVGADTSQGAPGDALEYSAAAGAAAFIFGRDNVIASVDETYSFMTDTPDFWRREYQHYPRHAGRFTGEPSYFKHVLGAARGIMTKTGMTPKDFTYVVFHQPNGKFPLRAGKELGFVKEQIENRTPGSQARQHLLRIFSHGAHGHPGHRQARGQNPDGLLRIGRGERCVCLHRYRPDSRSAGQGRQDSRYARQKQGLHRLRNLCQISRQDPESRVRRNTQ